VPFHPCGQVLDYLRVAYRTKMRVWHDGIDQVVPVRWFRAAAGAKFLGLPTVFGSWKGWSRGEDNTGQIGEQTSEFTYDKGVNIIGYTGEQRCGPDIAIMEGGRRDRDPALVPQLNGNLACCGPVLVCGLEPPPRWQFSWAAPAGCDCMGVYQLTLHENVFERIPGVFRRWVAAPLGTLPFWWGGGCPGGPHIFPFNVHLRLIETSCQWFLTIEYHNGIQLQTLDATPQLVPDTVPYLYADTNVPSTWSEITEGALIWNVGDCEAQIGNPLKRFLMLMNPDY